MGLTRSQDDGVARQDEDQEPGQPVTRRKARHHPGLLSFCLVAGPRNILDRIALARQDSLPLLFPSFQSGSSYLKGLPRFIAHTLVSLLADAIRD